MKHRVAYRPIIALLSYARLCGARRLNVDIAVIMKRIAYDVAVHTQVNEKIMFYTPISVRR